MEERVLAELQSLKQLTLLSAKSVLTLEDASLVTNLSKSRLYKLTSNRQIPHYKQGRVLYFDKSELEAWMRENKVATVSEIQSEALSYCAANQKNY